MINTWTNPQGNLSDKDYYLTFWGFTLGTPEAEQEWANKCAMHGRKGEHLTMVVGDIQPYKSMIDGTMIMSRSQHRTHLRDHNCIEIGNEVKHLKHDKPLESPSGLKETVIRAYQKAKDKQRKSY